MQSSMAVIFSAYLAQAAGSALLSIMLLLLYRFYRQRYLMDWTLSFWAGSLAFSGAAVALTIMGAVPSPLHPARVVASLVLLVAGYLKLVWLLAGAYGATGFRKPGRRTVRISLVAVPAVAVVASAVFIGLVKMPEAPLLGRLAISGGAHLVAAAWVLHPRRERRLVGQELVAASLALLGIIELHNSATHLLFSIVHVRPSYVTYVPYVSLILQFVVGFGVLMWLLEAERLRALQTSRQVERLAFYDSLTGLANRELFLMRLSEVVIRARGGAARPALLLLDLDRFKIINDSLGYATGDALLTAVARRLRGLVSPDDTLARISGDEFAILKPSNRTLEEARGFADRVTQGFQAPISLQGQDLFLAANVGITLYPDGGMDAEGLLKSALVALNLATEKGKGTVQVYTPDLSDKATERISLENDLRKALAQGELALFYQPVVTAEGNVLRGAEALVRWQHPERGLLGPGDFLSALEAYGLGDAMDLWALRSACAQVKRWQDRFHIGPIVSVNLSARPFESPDLVARISAVLDETSLHPGHLELEITESIAMLDPQATREVLLALRRLGVRTAIDDFGTGYSSLSYLRSLPVQTLKLDHSFIRGLSRDPRARALADSILMLARSLDLQVVAEGVEEEEQRTALKAMGCDLLQGYLLGRPVPPDEFSRRHLTDAAAAGDPVPS
ncbi:MAG: EAL domain-containing protein [Acidobacteria bacterium]|nr:EAL domain-containing protein [Acidobacteriota bacterium]